MKLKKIVLDGSTRMIPLGTNYFEFTPESDEIIIIGTNGSGKSTVINYWTPLPPEKMNKEFIKGGKKESVWEHRGSTYTITSVNTGGAGTHSFTKDDEVILENGTASVLTQLVKEHFNIDRDLHELMVGKKRFTTMSVTERREWIMRVSGGDFQFVMDLFTKASIKMRDSLGALRHNKQRLIELEKDRVSEETVTEYKNNLDEINKVIFKVIDIKQNIKPVNKIPSEPMSYLESVLRNIEELSNRNIRILSEGFKTLDNLEIDFRNFTDRTDTLESELKIRNEQLNVLLDDLKQLNEKEKIIEESKSLSVLEKELNETNIGISEISEKYKDNILFEDITEPDHSVSVFNSIDSTLNSILVQWSYNLASDNTEEEYKALKEKRIDIENYIIKVERQVSEIQHRLIHVRNSENVECPKCTHNWKIGVSEGEETKLSDMITKGEELLVKAKDKKKEVTHKLELLESFLEVKREYISLTRNTPALNSLWVKIRESKALTDPKVNIKTIIDKWISIVKDKALFIKLSNTKNNLEEKIKFIKSFDLDTKGFTDFKTNLEDKIQNQYTLIDNIKVSLDNNKIALRAVNNIQTIYRDTKSEIENLKAIVKDVVSTIGASIFENVNTELNTDSYHLNSLLIRSQNSYSVLNELENSLKDLTRIHEAYTVLVSELSPKEGFVAELLTSFIKQMLGDMNEIIGLLWTYDLEIQMCKKAETELDFRFPLSVRNNEHCADDVKDGSSSQVDVVDFAFKYVVSQYLGLSDYPFLLDELAPTFDELHRRNIMHFVRQLIDTDICSQMVMISHYAETHSAFVNSEYVVTDSFNITVPSIYNKNAIFR